MRRKHCIVEIIVITHVCWSYSANIRKVIIKFNAFEYLLAKPYLQFVMAQEASLCCSKEIAKEELNKKGQMFCKILLYLSNAAIFLSIFWTMSLSDLVFSKILSWSNNWYRWDGGLWIEIKLCICFMIWGHQMRWTWLIGIIQWYR